MLTFPCGGAETGEQDQGIPFKGPTAAAAASADSSAIETTPEVEQGEFPPLKNHMASALRRDSFQNIGQRRRSSASNQPTVNLRRGSISPPPLLPEMVLWLWQLICSSRVLEG